MSRISNASSTTKRVRFSPDCKDCDDMSTPLPNTPRRPVSDWQMPSPPLSDSSSLASESDVFLHTLLLPRTATQNPILFDVRCDPQMSYVMNYGVPTPLLPHTMVYATQPAMTRIQLISRLYPWTILVENPTGVTVQDILYRIHASVFKNVGQAEYDTLSEGYRAEVLKAYQANCQPVKGLRPRQTKDGLKRVDYLGRRTCFAGIQKDEKYIATRVFDSAARAETFVLEFALAS